MTMGFGITLEGDEDLARKLSDRRTKLGPMVAVAANPIEAYVAQIGIAATKYAKQNAPEDTGALKKGISFIFQGGSGVVVSKAKHTVNVVKGRGAGKRFPPIDVIRAWVVRHGMPESAAYPVARAIATRGIPPKPFLREAFGRMMRIDVPKSKRKFVSGTERNWAR